MTILRLLATSLNNRKISNYFKEFKFKFSVNLNFILKKFNGLILFTEYSSYVCSFAFMIILEIF